MGVELKSSSIKGSPDRDAFEAAWRSRFEEFAEVRDDDAGIAGWSRAGLDARVRQFLRYWTPAPANSRWLDAGCGAGTYSRILRQQDLEVIGTDYSLPTLQKAKLRTVEPIMFGVADVRRLPFRHGTFDGALCLGVMQALSRSDEAVRALATVVRPGGEVWIDALNRWCFVNLYDTLRRWRQGRRMHLRYESPGVLKELMRSNGLAGVRLYWLPLLPARLKRFQSWIETPVALWIFRFVPLAGLLFCYSFIVRGKRRVSEPG